jgi:hypothetical protein
MIKGVHIDFRAQKMKIKPLLALLDQLKSWGFNTVLAEYMDGFPFEGELACLAGEDAMTKEEMKQFVEKAHALEIEIIPLLQCFGHSYWILRHDEFVHLSEGYYVGMPENEIHDDAGIMRLCTLCPSKPDGKELYGKMVSQVMAMHPHSGHFHIGGDEIRMNRDCPACSQALENATLEHLITRHYVDCIDIVASNGVQPIMWCDVLLAYQETMDALTGRVTVMDWDYVSTVEGRKGGRVWGVPSNIMHQPDLWPEDKQELRKFAFLQEPTVFNPYFYADYLKSKGFTVIAACATRCSGDSFCVPAAFHPANVKACVRKAVDSKLDGFMVTSWSMRRAPFSLTWFGLITASMAYENGTVTWDEIGRAYSKYCFGNEDQYLGMLPELLGKASEHATKLGHLLSSQCEYSDYQTGNFFSPPWDSDSLFYKARMPIIRENAKAVAERFHALQETVNTTRNYLHRATPQNEEQQFHLSLWYWACDVLEFYCELAKELTREVLDDQALASWAEKAKILSEFTKETLSPLYTDFTIIGEVQNRFGVFLQWLKKREA